MGDNKSNIDVDKIVKHWIETSDDDFNTMLTLYNSIGLDMSDEYSDWLDEITSFNLNARYDDFKKEFYKLCTPDYTQNWIEKIKIIRTWIKEML